MTLNKLGHWGWALNAKGDVLGNDGTNPIDLPVGADGLFLKADSTAPQGLSWAAAGGASYHIDGGVANSVYTPPQNIDGGSA